MRRAGYFNFILKNRDFLGFGFLLTFICSLGQTFFIGFYNGHIREAFSLSNSGFGALYGLATLASAMTLISAGRLIDRMDLRVYTLSVLALMLLGCLLMAAGSTIWMLAPALALLRLSGQGLLPHISNTSMGRYFDETRGRAVSIAHLGLNAGQVALPLLAAWLIGRSGWRASWLVYALTLALLVMPLVVWLLRDHPRRHAKWVELELRTARARDPRDRSLSLKKLLLGDRRFVTILPGILSISLFGTSLLFFQDELLAARGWGAAWFAWSFPFYSVGMLAAVLGCGWLVDRLGNSLKLLPFVYVPFIVALLVLSCAEAPGWLPLMLLLIGVSHGLVAVVGGTLWPELYGTEALGRIRALVNATMVMGTAVMPTLVGYLYDAGVSISASYLAFAAYMLICGILQLPLGYRRGASDVRV
ncbi:MAG: MFS transporter [Kiritimatiellia bacterium]|nr:MFS transporter [Lentisphaerota bacterium]